MSHTAEPCSHFMYRKDRRNQYYICLGVACAQIALFIRLWQNDVKGRTASLPTVCEVQELVKVWTKTRELCASTYTYAQRCDTRQRWRVLWFPPSPHGAICLIHTWTKHTQALRKVLQVNATQWRLDAQLAFDSATLTKCCLSSTQFSNKPVGEMSENVRLLKIQALSTVTANSSHSCLYSVWFPSSIHQYQAYIWVSRHLSIALTYRAQFRHTQASIQWNACFVYFFSIQKTGPDWLLDVTSLHSTRISASSVVHCSLLWKPQ